MGVSDPVSVGYTIYGETNQYILSVYVAIKATCTPHHSNNTVVDISIDIPVE